MRTVLVRIVAATVLAVTLAACGGGGEGSGPGVRVVGTQEAASLLAAEPGPVLLDVRTPAEFAEERLEGAVLVDYSAPDFRDRVAELDPTASYVVYCRSGNRSAGARAVLEELGFVDVADIEGGIVAWAADGLPVVTG